MPPSMLPIDANGDIDVSAWAANNLDQDILHKTVKDLKILQEELQNEFGHYAFRIPVDRIAIFRSLEGQEFPIYLPYVHMTARAFLPYASTSSVYQHPPRPTPPPTIDISLPFHTWQVRAAISFWKTRSLDLSPITSSTTLQDTPQQHTSLVDLIQLTNLAHHASDPSLLSTIHSTLRNRLLTSSYSSDTELLDAVKFIWTPRPFSFAVPTRYEEVRRILLTYLVGVRERVVRNKYFQEIVEEMGGEGGELMEEFNLGQVWWEGHYGGGRLAAWEGQTQGESRGKKGRGVRFEEKENYGREKHRGPYGGKKSDRDGGAGKVPLGESTRGNIGVGAKGRARRLTFG